MQINGRRIDNWLDPYIVAEISGNHNGEISKAIQLIEAAHASGADAVKLQAYTPDTITLDHDGPGFVLRDGPWRGRKLYDLYKEAHTPWEWFPSLFGRARELGITCFASAFDKTSVDMLEGLDTPAYKMASFELVDIPLLGYVARTGKPVILSTGMAEQSEINLADECFASVLEGISIDHMFLHCVSGYPTPIEQANLQKIEQMRSDMVLPIGLSDHSLSTDIPLAATSLGTALIEKHMCLERANGGPDAEFSMEPHEFKDMVSRVRAIYKATRPSPVDCEKPQLGMRKSLYVVKGIGAGELVSEDNVRALRPGYGLPPRFWDMVVGKAAKRGLRRGEPLALDDLS